MKGETIMRREYTMAIKEQAESLFVEKELTYLQVSKVLKVPYRTVKGWGLAGKWKARRERYYLAVSDLKQALRHGNLTHVFDEFIREKKGIQMPRGVIFQSRRKRFFELAREMSEIFSDHH